jgi:hypothetical protein
MDVDESYMRLASASAYFNMLSTPYIKMPLRFTPPPPSPPPSIADISSLVGLRIIMTPTDDTVRLLGGDRFQQRQAARRIPPATDWRAVMQRGFIAPKKTTP